MPDATPGQIFQPCGALQWMQFVQHLLFALIAWVTIGVYGSWYVLKGISRGPPEGFISSHDTVFMTRPEEREDPGRLVLDTFGPTDDSPTCRAHDMPKSPKEMRLIALLLCGLLGIVAILALIVLAFAGSRYYGIRAFVARWLITGGPDWAA